MTGSGNGRRLRGTPFGITALVAAGLLFAATPAAASETDWRKLRQIDIAHQGGEDEAPSNTMYAYERALRLGADMLEVDIHTTADGRLVVLHDGTVDRTTNGSGSVYDMTLKQVRALDAAYNFVPGESAQSGRPVADYPFRGVRTGERKPPPGFKRRDFRIATLGEVMRAYPDVPINIEIKGASDADVASYLRNAEALAALLNRLGRTEGIIVASFHDEALQRFHELAPEIDMAPAVGAVAAYKFGHVPPPEGTVAFQVPTEFEGVTVTDREFVERAHSDGYAVHVWTINDEQTMRQLLGWGTDGIMTAQPMRLERVLCRSGTKRPDRPASVPGWHCNGRASIACKVDPVRVDRTGKRVRVVLRRRDEFSGKCAGRLAFGVPTAPGRELARFSFGWRPPSEGGPVKRTVKLELSRHLRRATLRTERARLKVRPYGAFVERERLRLR
jgi:glycerophosphoryl diester phosphodiesterase